MMMRPLPSFSRRGMALVIVLGALVLITLLCVAFLASTNKELSASKSYASGVSARIYADAAVNVVLGQLRAATTVDDASQTWTSQPGLLRTFNNQGKQTQVFKLYSSDKMVDGAGFSLISGSQPSDVPAWSSSSSKDQLPWNAAPGVYTDLNSPVTIDKRPSYPILNPGGLDADTRIQGFDVSPNYALPDKDDLDGDGDTTEIGQIPMPVRWIYVLKDGSLATASGGKTVRLVLPNGNTVPDGNPPVARIAFWTDDDTCRLNVNTASEGSFWTLPVIAGADDSLSSGQVNAREYQRYPGHPATTSLSPVLDFLTTNKSDLSNFIYSLTPRVAGRGSQVGTRMIGYSFPVQNDQDRLYASVDELLFLPKYDGGTGQRYRMTTQNMKALKEGELDFKFTGSSRQMSGTTYSFTDDLSLDPERLELVRFFLTVDSNAPEINLFGKPRVSLWPVDTRPDYQSASDRLLAMCATLDGSEYYFQRQNPASRTDDYDKITRNQTLLSYLDSLTATPIPGIGGSFSSKYPVADREQLLTSIFDWVRTVNLAYRDKQGAVKPYAWQNNPAANGTTNPPGLPGSGQVLPIKIKATSGYGRFPTLSKGALAVIREEELVDKPTPGQVTVKYRAVFLMETFVPMMGFAGYVPDYQIAVNGLAGGFEAVTDVPTITGSTIVSPLSFGDGTIEVNVPANVEPFTGRAWGGTQGYNNLFLYSDPAANYQLSDRTIGSSDSLKGYPFVSAQFQVIYPKTNSSGADIKDTIRVGLRPSGGGSSHMVTVKLQDMGGDTISSYDLSFPGFGPLVGAFPGDGDAAAGNAKLASSLQIRVNQLADACKLIEKDSGESWAMKKIVIGANDVIRGLELEHGDLRLLALTGTDTISKFIPHKDYTNTGFPQAHSLLGACGQFWSTSNLALKTPATATPATTVAIRRGTLVNGTATAFSSGTPLNYLPQAPSQMTNVPAPGDFTTSLASEGDGPAILKADEGNSSLEGFNWGQSARIPYQNQLFPWDDNLTTAFSPNRQVASAVQLGTLPSRAASGIPWETLLFRPDIAPMAHPGAASPADSALLDLFWMPVVDPYPISRTFSTAGKVNMNCQIAPFTYVERTTALMGALKSVRVLAFPKEHAGYYKWSGYTVDTSKSRWAISYLYDVDASQTLLFFKERFADSDPSRDVFQSASEICSIPLAPKHNVNSVIGTGHSEDAPEHPISSVNIAGASDAGALRTAIKSFWARNTLTGDNAWEAPYNNLYPRLTTQSNTYTVYVKAQTIQVAPETSLGSIPESRLRVTGEYRGSFDVERYLDSADTSIPDFAQAANFSKTIYPYYKFRIRSSRQFLPQ